MLMARVHVMAAVAALALGSSSCGGAPIDLAQSLQVFDVTSGWYDAGIVEGYKNKLVPSLTLRLRNAGQTIGSSVQLNAVFRRVGEAEEWGSTLIRAIGPEGLASGAETPPVNLRSDLGYTGTDPRDRLLNNRLFVDARVELFAKHGSAQWVRLAEYRIERRLLTD